MQSTPQESVGEATADVGAHAFCRSCAFSRACTVIGYGKRDLAALQYVVEHAPPLAEGEYVVRRGEPFRAIYAVRTGSVKASVFSRDGREQVLGFYLPGEVVGLNGIYPDCHPSDAIALERSTFCRFSFPAMSDLAATVPAVQQHLFRMLSRELGMASRLPGDHTADERVAAFLMDLGQRHGQRGLSDTVFQLTMSRSDVASHLRLAPETVSRVLSRFRAKGWVSVEGRRVQLRHVDALRDTGFALWQVSSAA